MRNNQLVVVARDSGGVKEMVPLAQAVEKVKEMLEALHQRLFDR